MESLVVALLTAVAAVVATWAAMRGGRRRAIVELESQLAMAREQNAALGGAVEYLRSERDKATAALRGETERRAAAEERAGRVDGLDATVARLSAELSILNATLAASEAKLAAEQQSARQNLRLLEEAREKLSDAFKALSSEALKSNNQATGSLETRVLVTARKFPELGIESADAKIMSIEPIDLAPRRPQAVELLPRSGRASDSDEAPPRDVASVG